jgi:hypothetical protein
LLETHTIDRSGAPDKPLLSGHHGDFRGTFMRKLLEYYQPSVESSTFTLLVPKAE